MFWVACACWLCLWRCTQLQDLWRCKPSGRAQSGGEHACSSHLRVDDRPVVCRKLRTAGIVAPPVAAVVALLRVLLTIERQHLAVGDACQKENEAAQVGGQASALTWKYVQPCLQLHSCSPCCPPPALALATRASRRHAHATVRILGWVSGPPGVLVLPLLLADHCNEAQA